MLIKKILCVILLLGLIVPSLLANETENSENFSANYNYYVKFFNATNETMSLKIKSSDGYGAKEHQPKFVYRGKTKAGDTFILNPTDTVFIKSNLTVHVATKKNKMWQCVLEVSNKSPKTSIGADIVDMRMNIYKTDMFRQQISSDFIRSPETTGKLKLWGTSGVNFVDRVKQDFSNEAALIVRKMKLDPNKGFGKIMFLAVKAGLKKAIQASSTMTISDVLYQCTFTDEFYNGEEVTRVNYL